MERVDPIAPAISMVPIDCPLCGSDRSTAILSTRDFVYGVESPDLNGQFRFVQCDRCRHLYLNPRPSNDSLGACYPANYAPHRSSNTSVETPANDDQNPKSAIRRAFAKIPFLKRFLFWLGQQHATFLPPLPKSSDSAPACTARLLEIGCAHGGFLSVASDAGWEVSGLEPNDAAANRARERGFDVQTGTLSQAQLPGESRESIVAWMVLEHVPDPKQMVVDSFRILAPGGWFSVSVPNAGGYERRMFGRYWLGYDAPRHLQIFTATRLRELLSEAGYVEIKIVYQASIRYVWGSIAAWGMDRFPNAEWPNQWMRWFIHEPPTPLRIAALFPEKLFSVLHLTGRITVSARKPN